MWCGSLTGRQSILTCAPSCYREFEVQFQRLFQIFQCFFFGLALAGDVDFEAL